MLLVVICLHSTLYAQNLNDLTYQAYLTGSLELWQKAIDQVQGQLKHDPENKMLLFDLAMIQYGLLNSTMATKDEPTFDQYVDETKELLERLIEADKKWAEPRAILSSVYGLQMGYSPWKGMFLGSKSSSLMDKAMKLNDQSPLVVKLYAGSKLFTPEMFGGDIQDAANSYENCIKLYEKQPDGTKLNWLYLDALAFLGQSYSKLEKHKMAISAYEKALEHEPEFNWVKYGLLPGAQSKIN